MKKLNLKREKNNIDYNISMFERETISFCEDNISSRVTSYNGRYFLTYYPNFSAVAGKVGRAFRDHFSMVMEISEDEAAAFIGGEFDSISGSSYLKETKERQVWHS